MSKHKQIESELHCRATAELNASITEDLDAQDKSIKDLIGEDVDGSLAEKAKDNKSDNC